MVVIKAAAAQKRAGDQGGAGLVADVSYAAQTKSGWQLPSYWRFTIWGEEGAVEFKFGTGKLLLIGKEKAEEMECAPVNETWLDDFVKPYDEAAVEDIIASCEAALLIQQAADRANG